MDPGAHECYARVLLLFITVLYIQTDKFIQQKLFGRLKSLRSSESSGDLGLLQARHETLVSTHIHAVHVSVRFFFKFCPEATIAEGDHRSVEEVEER